MTEEHGVIESLLVIAQGNPLRSDDGIAWQAAEELRRVLPPMAQVICVHQLTPELAENASHADLVIFLDAASNGDSGTVRCRPLTAETGDMHFSHHLTPQAILAICDRLYSAKPYGFLISIPGACFAHGQDFSPAALHAIPQVVAQVDELLRKLSGWSQIRMRPQREA